MRIATRGSALALWQANFVRERLEASGQCDEVEIIVISTSGDRDKQTPLHQIGGKGIFVKEVQAAVLDGRADVAVHSAKDMPAISPDGLVLGAVPDRADPRDVLIGSTLAELSVGATVATGSVRRRAQLHALRPDLVFRELRGNIATRLQKASDFDAIVMAAAALARLGESPATVDFVNVDLMVPQCGQGALAIEHRADDGEASVVLKAVNHPPSRRVFECERAFLRELGGDCSLPAGAHAVLQADDSLALTGFLASEDLERSTQSRVVHTNGENLGVRLAQQLLAQIES